MTLTKIKADTYREFGKFSWFNLTKGFIFRRNFRVITLYRACHYFAHKNIVIKLIGIPFKFLFKLFSSFASIDLPCKTEIGAGISIAHGWGLVINENAQIGQNVTLFHGVTLGRRDRISSDGNREIGYPIIEDDVWIGPNAIVVGNVRVGKGSRIGAGAFVTKDVPPYSTVVGNPSSVVKENSPPDVMNKVPDSQLE